jgi:hypothetical protein
VAPPDGAELRTSARGAQYAEIGDGWEAGEWTVKGRSSNVRFVALRHARSARPEPQIPFLFRDPQKVYFVFAADAKTSPREALDAFAAREASQVREHALLKDFPVNRLLSRGEDAHGKFLPLFLLAADLLQWYRRSLA